MKSLSIKDLDVCYGSFKAVNSASIDVNRGEFVALLGPSGCGKTSLLRSIAGFVPPASGAIRIGESDISNVPSRSRNLGIVFQSYALFPHMTAVENVSFGLECRNIDKADVRKRALETLDMVGLSKFGDRKPRHLSGGQQQRVALARALVIRPDILLLDEPLGALDRKLRLQMQAELKALQSRLGVTTVMVTHDQEEAMVLADRIAVMRDGIIEQIATPEILFSRPRTPWIADFMGAGNVLKGKTRAGRDGSIVFVSEVLEMELENTGKSQGQAHQDEIILFLRSDGIKFTRTGQDNGLQVTAKRYRGFNVEVEATKGEVSLRALMSSSACDSIDVGSWVTPSVDRQSSHIMHSQ